MANEPRHDPVTGHPIRERGFALVRISDGKELIRCNSVTDAIVRALRRPGDLGFVGGDHGRDYLDEQLSKYGIGVRRDV